MAAALGMQDVWWYCPVLCHDGGAVSKSVVLTTQVVMIHDGGWEGHPGKGG